MLRATARSALRARRHRTAAARAAAGAVLLGLLAACGDGGARAPSGDDAALGELTVETQVLDVLAAFAAGRVDVEASNPSWPLALFPPVFEKGAELESDKDRLVLRAHAESAFTVRTPPLGPAARLVARTLVYSDARNDPARADPVPLEFRIAVDGVEQVVLGSAYVREPRENVYDQVMRELDVDLSRWEGREVTLRFATTRDAPVPDDVVLPEPVWWSAVVTQETRVPRQRASTERPDLLVLCVDTLAARRMSLFGYARDTTPRLSAFAAGGTVFETAVSPSSWTLPATASMLTGLPPNTHGVLGDGRDWLMDALATWPERLREAGIAGAAFVGNPLVSPSTNFHQGFVHFESDPGTGRGDADAESLAARLLAWVDEQPRDARWFGYVHLMDPHAPYGPPRGRERFSEGYVERRSFEGHLPGMLQQGTIPPLAPDEQAHVGDLYDAEVAYLDASLGTLLDGLAARGRLERTVVVLVADHGEELFEHGRLGHGYALSDVMLRVPLAIVGPGVPAGRRVKRPVSTAALANTLLVLAGLEPDERAEPALLPLDETPRRDPVFSLTRTSLFGPRQMLVSARDADGRKVVLELDETSGAERGRTLFDLRIDAGETSPLDAGALAPSEARAYEWLAEGALAWYDTSRHARPAGTTEDVDVDASLSALGYLQGGGAQGGRAAGPRDDDDEREPSGGADGR